MRWLLRRRSVRFARRYLAVLVLHGNAGDRGGRAPLARALRARGLDTLLLDYRGFGGNPGRPSREGLLRDAAAAGRVLRERSGFDRRRTIYFGESLGTGVAAWLAAEEQPAAVVLRSPFPDVTSVAARRLPWLPVRALLDDTYPTASWIADYDGPVLVVAGGRDRIVPPAFSRQVADAAAQAEVVTAADVGHNDRALLDGAAMLEAVTAFLRDRTGIPVRDAPGDA